MTKQHITVNTGMEVYAHMSLISRPLLAARVEDNDLNTLKFPVGITSKVDGIRCLKIDGHAVSRTFKPIPNNHIRTSIEEFVPDGMDMEITVPEYPKGNFQETSGNVMREDSINPFKVWIIDYVTDSLTEPYQRRIQKAVDYATEHWKKVPFKWEVLTPVTAKDKNGLDELESQALEEGFEGVMIRDLNGRYKCGRSTFSDQILIKVKRFVDAEAVVRGIECLYHNGNEAQKDAFGRTKRSTAQDNLVAMDTMGKLVVEGHGGDFHGVDFSIGTGFTQEQRDQIWKDRVKLVGHLCKFKYFGQGVDKRPRFPTFIGWRHPDDL